MAQLTRIGVGGVGQTYGAITDKEQPATPRPGTLFTRIGVGGVGAYYVVTDKGAAEVSVPSNGVGGNYGGRILPSLADYEKRIAKQLRKEKKARKKEAKELEIRLDAIAAEKVFAQKQEEIRQTQEIELKYEIVSESLLQVEKDLAEIERKRANIKLMARIMRDDDEVILLIYG